MALSEDDIKELKAMVLVAKRAPVNFAVCFGKKPENAVVMMDKKVKPDILGRNAKKAGETAKVCSGVLAVDGKNATLTCEEKPPSGVAKHLFKFFQNIGSPLVFELRDVDGNVLKDEDDEGNDPDAEISGAVAADEDEEELLESEDETEADDPAKAAWDSAWAGVAPRVATAIDGGVAGADKIKAVRDFTLAKAGAADYAGAQKALQTLVGLLAAAPAAPAAKLDDAKALVERLKALKGQIAAADPLNALYVQAVTLMKAADMAGAAALVDRIEAGLANPSQSTASGPAKSADPRFAKVAEAADKLRGAVSALQASVGQDAMLELLDSVDASIASGEAEAAVSGMKRVQEGLKLQAEVDRLSPLVAAAASSGKVADVNALNLLFNMVAEAVPAADLAEAMDNLAKVEAMIAGGGSAFGDDIAEDVRPIAISQLNWVKSRTTVRSEIARLQAAIVKICTEVGDLQPVIDQVGALLDYVAKLDERLEDKLNDIVNEPAGAKRDTLKQEARGLLAEYQGELAQPFFADVDSGNGFADVAVASTARAALAEISNALAA